MSTKFSKFVTDIVDLIPEGVTDERFTENVKQIVEASQYYAPEVITMKKAEFCNLLTKSLPLYNPPTDWQMKIIESIRTIRFE